MPAAQQYVAALEGKPYRDQREKSEAEFRERRKQHKTNWQYYSGQHQRFLKPTADGIDDNVVLNMQRQIVDRRVAFLFPSMPRLELTADRQTSTEEQRLNDVWKTHGGATLMANAAVNGSVDGHVFMRLVETGEGIRLVNLPGANVIAWWKADDYHEVLWYELSWQVGEDRYRQDVVRDGETWLIRDFFMRTSSWEMIAEETWPHNFAPIVDWQHLPNPRGFYGQHEFSNAALNDTVNMVASNVNRIIRFHAHPRTIVTGADASDIHTTAANQIFSIKNKDARVQNLEMRSDLSSSMKFLELIRDFFYDLNAVTVLPSDVNSFTNVTNFGVRAAFMPMLNANAVLRRNYGERGIAEVARRWMVLVGIASEQAAVAPTLHWADPLPTDQREIVEMQQAEIDMGTLSQQSAMQQRGRDPQQERESIMNDAEFASSIQEAAMIGGAGVVRGG